jgi:hypothetical protein
VFIIVADAESSEPIKHNVHDNRRDRVYRVKGLFEADSYCSRAALLKQLECRVTLFTDTVYFLSDARNSLLLDNCIASALLLAPPPPPPKKK